MLRVLTLATLFPNGAEPNLGLFVERQTRALAARPGVEVAVVAPVGLPVWPLVRHPHYARRAALPLVEDWNGLRVHRPRYRVWPKAPQARTAAAMAAALLPVLRDLRDRFRFDVIDAEFFWPDGPAAMRLSRALGVPFTVKARGSDIHYWCRQSAVRAEIEDAGRAASALFAVSAAMAADLAALGLPRDRLFVHHTGVDLDRFRPGDRAAAKAAFGISGPLIVTAGALIPLKGQDLAIAALAHLPEDAHLILVGGGPERERLEALARPFGSRVRILGPRPQDDVARLLAAADVMLHPSRSEGLANVWVESLASGTPVVAPDVGGAREVIDRPAAGRLADRTPEALAAAVRDLLAAPPPQQDVRAAATRFSWGRNAQELETHLRRCVEDNPLSPRERAGARATGAVGNAATFSLPPGPSPNPLPGGEG
ncbi:MAG: glycosyltransferase [Allosphingosinicella sp.]|uniref:glycosyltransferase n=1 Tax=Allosphingosinicella sp. TaxID=2823234 RepID=UPI0039329F6F